MTNNGPQSLESAPFHELGEKPGLYTFAPVSSPEEAVVLRDQADFIGAIGVTVDTADGDPVFAHHFTPSFDGLPVEAAEKMAESYEEITALVEDNPLAQVLENIKNDTLIQGGESFYRNGHKLIGGLAVYRTAEGYKSGIFASRKLEPEVKWSIGGAKLLYNEYSKYYRQAPDELKTLVAMHFPRRTNQELNVKRAASLVMKSIITEGLPEKAELRVPSQQEIQHYAPFEQVRPDIRLVA